MRESQIETYLVAKVKALGGEVRKVEWIGRRSVFIRPAGRLRRRHRATEASACNVVLGLVA